MEFLIVLGLLSVVTMTVIRGRLLWEVDPDETVGCVIEEQKRDIKRNKLFWNIFYYGGIGLILIGVVGSLLIG